MVRIDPITLKIDIFDDTFAFTTSSQFSETIDMPIVAAPVPFGMVEGCTEGLPALEERQHAEGRLNLEGLPFTTATTQSCQGTFVDTPGTGNIDLTSTPFKVTDPFYLWGSNPTGSATLSSFTQVVDLSAIGACGEIAPELDGNRPGAARKYEWRYLSIDFL